MLILQYNNVSYIFYSIDKIRMRKLLWWTIHSWR